MKTYERPIVLVNEELAEGVYAASGVEPENPPLEESSNSNVPTPEPTPDTEVTTDCWTVDAVSVQDSNGSHHVFEVRCVHSTAVEHISTNTTVTLTFSSPLTDAYSEFTSSFSGSTVTINRTLHANAYQSGDTMSYKVWVQGSDEATTKSIACTGKTISCQHAVNVQGKYD